MEDLFGTPVAALAWETDRLCRRLAAHRLPWLQHRGDFTGETVEKVAAEIRRADPAGECVVLLVAAPPCQDFSQIGAEAGHRGARGGLFLRSAEFVFELRTALRGWRVGFLFENVVMEPASAKEVSDCLGVPPVLVCASDFGWISRPRLWWLSADLRQCTTDPASGAPLAWTKKGPFHRLRLEEPRAAAAELLPKGLAFHPAVASSRLLLPCSTTPAEDENGRPAPKRARGKIPEPARARWLADSRQFAPWHYVEEAMLHDEAGRLHNIPAGVKEALHGVPEGYTDLGDGDERSRHRMIANGWHWGVARRLLAMLMALTVAQPAEASVPAWPRTTTVAWMAAQFGGGPLDMSPPPRLASRLDLPEDDPDEHWRQALRLTHCTVTRRPSLEPAVERVLELLAAWRHDVVRIRGEVLQEIKEMVADRSAETAAWLSQRPAPVRSTYSTPDKDRPTQVPVLLDLLGAVGYPDLQGITADLTQGFDMLGEVRRGPGWKNRQDGRYQNPASLDQLSATNWEYVRRRAAAAKPGEHWETLLTELVAEVKLGRVVGPTHPPAGWNIATVPVLNTPGADRLVTPPPGRHFVAASFAIVQEDGEGNVKVRRGEDWRRSGHNSTILAHDVPTHHFVDDVVDFIRRVVELAASRGVPAARLFGHDLLNAYRQWAVRHPAHSGTFLATPAGLTLWFHLAMCFGAAASVWNFNRAADALQALNRVLLWVVGGHFVDDFSGVDLPELAASAFYALADLFQELGLQTKPSKAQAPAARHVVQGVEMSIEPDGVSLRPTPARVAKILRAIETALDKNKLQPHAAQKLAGRLSFASQSTFGCLGKAALKPLYARAHDAAAESSPELSVGLAAALRALRQLLRTIQPRFVPFVDDGAPQALIYADAFFQPGEVKHKAGFLPAGLPTPKGARGKNGWGYVVRIGGETFYDFGQAPASFLAAFGSRRAFIYVLEIVAQVLALTALARRLPERWLAFIDNVAGQWALTKGYGRDQCVNGVLAAFWSQAAGMGWLPDFRRVPSKANVADAVSRGDIATAVAMGWTRVHTPAAEICAILAKTAGDLEFAIHGAAAELQALAI